jgi:hypothetical protein
MDTLETYQPPSNISSALRRPILVQPPSLPRHIFAPRRGQGAVVASLSMEDASWVTEPSDDVAKQAYIN